MSKILVLNGSPREERSLTLKVTKAFLKGLAVDGENEVEIVNLAQQEIQFCAGCFTCWEKTPGICVFHDAMPALLKAYQEADLVIWSMPLYYFGMPAQAKRFMDRLLPLCSPQIGKREDGGCTHPSRYPTKNQRFVLISGCGFCSKQNNYEALLKQFEILYGNRLTSIIRTEGELLKIEELKAVTAPYLKKVEAMGEEYALHGCVSPEALKEAEALLIPEEVYLDEHNAIWN